MRIQKRVKGGRKSLHPSVLKEVKRIVEKLAWEYKVSKSFVVNTILLDAFKIKGERYYDG